MEKDEAISSDRLIPETRQTKISGVTLRELATHTSGLPRMPPGYTGHPYFDFNPYYWLNRERLIQPFTVDHFPGQPGRGNYGYSNLGFSLLGTALSRAGGMTFADLIRTRITEPLGMKDTVILPNDEQMNRLVIGYGGDGEKLVPWEFSEATQGRGALFPTANDLLIYAEANLNPDNTPLGRAMIRTHAVEFADANLEMGLGWQIPGLS